MRRPVGHDFARTCPARGLTQEQARERSGFSQQDLSGLEQGRRNPTIVTLHELAQALRAGHVDLVDPNEGDKVKVSSN